MRKSFVFGISLLLLGLVLTQTASAYHQKLVLGEATEASQLVFPPVASGPGLILPDSPLFFLDKIKQNVRLLLAFTPEGRAKIRGQIAGERLAELRSMMVRSNQEGINTALAQLTSETDLASASLTDAASQGKDVKELASNLNETIKLQRKILGTLASQSRGALKEQLKAARKALKESKVEIEDRLDEDEIENEIEDGLKDEIDEEVEDASQSAQKVDRDLDKLDRHASEVAKKALKRREEALNKAIEQKNDALKKVEERLLENEKKKQENLLEAQKKASGEAREALKRAQQAAQGLKRAQERVNEIRNRPVGGTSDTSSSGSDNSGSSSGSSGSAGSSDSSGSSGSGSSGSGSDSSGSGSSGSGKD